MDYVRDSMSRARSSIRCSNGTAEWRATSSSRGSSGRSRSCAILCAATSASSKSRLRWGLQARRISAAPFGASSVSVPAKPGTTRLLRLKAMPPSNGSTQTHTRNGLNGSRGVRHLAGRERVFTKIGRPRASRLRRSPRPSRVDFAMPLRTRIECPECETDLVVKRGGVCPNCGARITEHVARIQKRERRIEQIVAIVATALVLGTFLVTSGASLLEGIAAYAVAGAVMYFLARKTFF